MEEEEEEEGKEQQRERWSWREGLRDSVETDTIILFS